MKTPLAWRNATHHKVRTAAALAGVAFAILLVFMQLGFYGACSKSATQIYEMLDFDIVLVSPQYVHLRKAGVVPRVRLAQAKGVKGVAQVNPLYVYAGAWRNSTDSYTREILVLGVDPDRSSFVDPEIDRQLPKLSLPDVALMDTKSQPLFGPHDVGTVGEVNRRKIEIVGEYTKGTGFIAGAAMIVSPTTYQRLFGAQLHRATMGLVKLAPGADVDAVAAELAERLPEDTRIMARADLQSSEVDYFVNIKPVGFMFKSGVLIGFLVGSVILYQILSADITRHLREYATLKAVGYNAVYLFKVVMQQGFIYAVLGYAPALLLSFGLYALVRALATIPMYMSWERVVLVLGLSVLMCSLSGLLAIRKVNAADPADLF